MWKVLKQRDVMQYGVVEEFVTSACEAVPGLLTVRHQGRLTVGLRARVSITGEGKSDLNVCLNHLSHLTDHSKDVKLMRTVRDFHSLIHTFLTDPAIREKFYKEVFPVDYGATFDQELEKLLWEFLVRLDQLLPVPNLVQTVAWLSDAPPVLEECAQAATQPQLLKILLQHETCLGHLESAASLPPNMGDSILASLSLPPSGRVPSDQPTAARKLSVDESEGSEPKSKPSFIAPVIGLISNEDVPVLNAGIKRTQRSDGPADNAGHEQLNSKFTSVKQRQKAKDKGAKEGREQLEEEEGCTLSQRSGVKRKNSDRGESDLEEEEVLSVTTPVEKRLSGQTQSKGDQRRKEGRAETIRKARCSREVLAARMRKLGVKTLYHPEDQHLYSVFVDCLSMEPRVVIEEMSTASLSASTSGTEETSSYKAQNKQRRKSPATASTQRQTSTYACLLFCSEVLAGAEGDDYVADSEDEATKNFKVRLFMKRYYKTKHGTYVPTLREFWKPAMTRRRLLSAGHKRR
uniref:TERF1-interacting nuclear factor 2 N-terminal domain-containing protein n=1 Tax=Oreochromis aureus TaxID=47969 RepID=A0A668R9S6_OREAU